jgi:hypothetical protein
MRSDILGLGAASFSSKKLLRLNKNKQFVENWQMRSGKKYHLLCLPLSSAERKTFHNLQQMNC